MTQENLMISIDVLRKEVSILTSRLRPAGTGYLHTAIDVIQSRVDELIEEVTAPYWKDEEGDIGRLPGQTRFSHLRSIEDAYEEEDNSYIDRLANMHNKKRKNKNTISTDSSKYFSTCAALLVPAPMSISEAPKEKIPLGI